MDETGLTYRNVSTNLLQKTVEIAPSVFRTIFEFFELDGAHALNKNIGKVEMDRDEHVVKKMKLAKESADDQRCQYWVQKKKRFCKMTVGKYFN